MSEFVSCACVCVTVEPDPFYLYSLELVVKSKGLQLTKAQHTPHSQEKNVLCGGWKDQRGIGGIVGASSKDSQMY